MFGSGKLPVRLLKTLYNGASAALTTSYGIAGYWKVFRKLHRKTSGCSSLLRYYSAFPDHGMPYVIMLSVTKLPCEPAFWKMNSLFMVAVCNKYTRLRFLTEIVHNLNGCWHSLWKNLTKLNNNQFKFTVKQITIRNLENCRSLDDFLKHIKLDSPKFYLKTLT